MKKAMYLLVGFLIVTSFVYSQDSLLLSDKQAFNHGEHLKFKIYYGFVNAGYAKLDILPESYTMCGRQTYRCVGIGESVGAFDWFFKVRDRYETYLDKEMISPVVFIRRVDEGGYTIKQDYVFNNEDKTVFTGKEFKGVPDNFQDMISAFYFARCIDFTKAKSGSIYSIPTFVDDSLYYTKLKYIKRETITTDLGTFRCLLFRPVIQTGRIFKNEEDLNVWISDDANKIPIRAQASILVGSVKMDLLEYSGLSNPTSLIQK